MNISIPGLGQFNEEYGLVPLEVCGDGFYKRGRDGVVSVVATGDRKVEFICFEDRALAYVASALGYPCYYPVRPVHEARPIAAVLMDLDGTTVKSEEFWVYIIGRTVASLLGRNRFEFEDADLPYVSGHSVSEHLKYCIGKYCPDKKFEDARAWYFRHTREEMDAILRGHGRKGAFTPAPGVKDFLLGLKARKLKIGLVTSGLYEKAYPEIVSAFDTLGMGDPKAFYESIITAGYPLGPGAAGTLGELCPKPHPWLYAETCRMGLGIDVADRNRVVGIEDSGAGICSIRLAGYSAVGIGGGNIRESGTLALCTAYCENFEEIMDHIDGKA
jgi:beta-phosphoglucomutase